SAFRVEKKHLNGSGNVHGGCFMAFADYCLFAIATHELDGPAVTTNFACDFLDAAREGELVECMGEVSRAGGSLIFLRGKLTSAGRPLFTFSGTIKRVKRKPARQENAQLRVVSAQTVTAWRRPPASSGISRHRASPAHRVYRPAFQADMR